MVDDDKDPKSYFQDLPTFRTVEGNTESFFDIGYKYGQYYAVAVGIIQDRKNEVFILTASPEFAMGLLSGMMMEVFARFVKTRDRHENFCEWFEKHPVDPDIVRYGLIAVVKEDIWNIFRYTQAQVERFYKMGIFENPYVTSLEEIQNLSLIHI